MARAYETVVEALNDLKARGFTTDFNLEENCLVCNHTSQRYDSEAFEVVEFYRFEGMTNPEDSSMLYAIRTQSGQQGVLLTAYGMYTDSMSTAILEKLRMH
ncbi:MAG: phosphoribosylpyrophosphate synthetase [Bacteroidetes bacterium]|nr:phosphoribosylpyrophosphate synthetase [Bacteroidota bacterium]